MPTRCYGPSWARPSSRDWSSSSPCQIPGAGRATRQRRIEPASLPELAAIVEGMPERLRLLVVLGAWCALRYGELAELRRHDVDLERGVLSISRAVVRVDGADLVGRPKSVAGVRQVAIPPHLYPGHPGAPRRARRPRTRRAALPAAGHQPPLDPHRGHQDLHDRTGGRGPTGPAAARPAAHRRGSRRPDRRDARRADGPARALHPWRRPPLPARSRRARRPDRGAALRAAPAADHASPRSPSARTPANRARHPERTSRVHFPGLTRPRLADRQLRRAMPVHRRPPTSRSRTNVPPRRTRKAVDCTPDALRFCGRFSDAKCEPISVPWIHGRGGASGVPAVRRDRFRTRAAAGVPCGARAAAGTSPQ